MKNEQRPTLHVPTNLKVMLGLDTVREIPAVSWTITRTRFAMLGYRQDAAQLWRVYNLDGTPRAVGPHYRTRAELLGDLERYAHEYGADHD